MNKLVVAIALTSGSRFRRSNIVPSRKEDIKTKLKQLKHDRSARRDNISAEALKADFDSSVIILYPHSKYVESKNNFKRMEREVSYQASYNRSS